MDKDKAMKWVKALRSGKYRQGRSKLKDLEGNYCCLGVLAEISGCDINYNQFYLPNDSLAQCRLKSIRGLAADKDGKRIDIKMKIDGKVKMFTNLASTNDNGVSFKQIANWIEKNYKFL